VLKNGTDRQTDRGTDGHCDIDSADDADQEHIYFMGSATPPSSCLMFCEVYPLYSTRLHVIDLFLPVCAPFLKKTTCYIWISKIVEH